MEETQKQQRKGRSIAEAKQRFSSMAKAKVAEATPERLKSPSQIQVRFRTGFVYIATTVVCVLVNDLTTVLMLSAVAAICAGEFYYMLRSDAKLPNEALGIIAAICYPFSVWWFGLTGALIVTIGLLIALLFWYVFFTRARVHDVGISLFGALYTGLLVSGIIMIRDALPDPWGGLLVFLLFLSILANDVFAYLFGSKFGKHKLSPKISPNKSWEGFIGGLVCSLVFWVLMIFIPGVSMSWWTALIFGTACGVMGVLGDLVESRIKRNVGAKDSGTIMPGHGGLLDRCDSLFLSSVAAAALLIYGGCIPYVF